MMLKKIKIYMPIICILVLVIILFVIMMNLFNKQLLQVKREIITNEKIDVGRKIDLKVKYPYYGKLKAQYNNGVDNHTINYIKNIEGIITSRTSTRLPFYKAIVNSYSIYHNFIDWNYNVVSNYSETSVLKLDNGYLSFASEKTDENELNNVALKLKEFKNFLDGNGINFYYINGGYKVPEEEKNLPKYNEKYENTDYNGKMLMKLIKKQGINVLDIREKAEQESKDWYSLFYKCDHHMKTDSQLWLAEKIAEFLKEKEGYVFDKNLFSLSEYNLEKKKIMFGSQARTMLKNGILEDLEEYTKIIPKFDTFFEIELPVQGKVKVGSYEDSLFENSTYRQIAETEEHYYTDNIDAYYCVTWKLDALGVIHNKLQKLNKGKKVLIIQDSFGCYTSTYLALGLEEVHLVYLPEFSGSIRTYIREVKPDVVLMLYTSSKANKSEVDPNSKFFDLE
ncbi:hypothetical protein [Catonella sp.]|uniref:hypothetical protein n=1 Tax=Clostridia TaxID=186801 RepID=UPI003FA14ED8